MNTAHIIQFKVGEVYECRSLCCYDSIYRWKVIPRTAKQLTLVEMDHTNAKPFKRGVRVYEGKETCRPNGSFSMCPVIFADRPKVTL